MPPMDKASLEAPYLTPPRRGPHQAIFMPDILRVILEYALQPLLEELRHRDLRRVHHKQRKTHSEWMNPLLVCRLWSSVGQRAVFRRATSAMEALSFNSQARFPHPLLHIARIHLTLPACFAWISFHEHVDPLLAHLGHLLSTSSGTARPQLRELRLTNLSPMRYLPLICRIPQLQIHLTLLELSSSNITALPVHRLLSSSTENVGDPSICLPNLRHLLLHGVEIAPLPDDFLQGSTIRLTTLRLDRVRAQLETLQTLLLAVAGPSLEQLSVSVYVIPVAILFSDEFLDTLAGLCRNLEWFQIQGTEDDPNTMTVLTRPFAARSQWIELVNTPKMTGALFTLDFRLGRLDISGRMIYNQKISRLLHQFLCEDEAAAAGLLELTLPAIRFNAAIFDPMWVHADEIPPGTWACASLQKLTIAFILPQYTNDRMTRCIVRRTYAQYAKASRLACGFVAVSCPQLVTLEIGFLGKAFDLDPEGGLCFLGRLQHLQHLTWRQANGLTQSFPHVYANALGRRPWPYDNGRQWPRPALVQAHKVAIPWFDASGVQELSLPVLRWMSTDPTDEDAKKKWTNLARCRYLYRLDNDVLLAVRLTVQGKGRRGKAGLEWQRLLEAMLTDKTAKEGASWHQLKSMICHAEPYDCDYYPSNHKEKGAFYDAFTRCYAKELQLVLPHVEVLFV